MWGIGGAKKDTKEKLAAFREQMGLTYPILYDQGSQTLEKYSVKKENSPYPQDWIVGVDGKIRYFNNTYDFEAMRTILDEELAKISK